MSDELRPCPACGGGDLASWPDDHGDATVSCQKCGMSGPTFRVNGPTLGISDETLDDWRAADEAARLKAEAAWNALPRGGPATAAFVSLVKAALSGADLPCIHFDPALGERFVKEHEGGDGR